MANQIVNAAPMVVDQGTQDLSTRRLPREQEVIPQHLPKFYLFAEKGPELPQLVTSNEAIQIFGINTFDLAKGFANHSTVFANAILAEGNACMLQRVVSADAGPEANLIAWLDVLPTTVDVYERNIDGSIKMDVNGDPIVTDVTEGYKVKWVVTHRTTSLAMNDFGSASVVTGDQVDSVTNIQSQRYPIFEIKCSSKGSAGNLAGIRMWAPTLANSSSLPTKLMNGELAYPYFLSVIRKPDAQSAPLTVPTLFGEQRITFVLKENVIDPLTNVPLHMDENFLSSYQNLTDPLYPKLFGDFGGLKVHQANVELLTTMFHAAEIPFVDNFSDFSVDPKDKHLFNFLTGVTSANTPYHSFVLTDTPTTVRLSEYTNIYAQGGSDGTLSDAAHAALVSTQAKRYLDPNDAVQEQSVNVESIFYDTGFPLATKYDLCSVIAVRKDTFVVLSTHDVNDRELTASEENSLAIALRTRLQMFPESDYFGTPVMRGMVVGRSGKIRNSRFKKPIPLSLEIARKAAKYMGASNGKWRSGANFDASPNNIVDGIYDINVTFTPASVRNKNWDAGLVWVQNYDRRSLFFPALKTVYDNDTSVLNSFFTAMAICQLNKVANAAWREFTGTSTLSNAQLSKQVNEFIVAKTKDIFDSRFVIKPEATFTDLDLLRGFSWTLPIKIYAANMKTVMSTSVQAYRIEDLNQ